MKTSEKVSVSNGLRYDNPDSYHFYVLEFYKLRFLNNKAIDFLSKLFVFLFDDFHLTLKR